MIGFKYGQTPEKCDLSINEYCLTHDVHIHTDGFQLINPEAIFNLAATHEMLTTIPANINPYITVNAFESLTEENLETVLAGMFQEETLRGEAGAAWDIQVGLHSKVDEMRHALIKSIENSYPEGYVTILKLFLTHLIPLRKNLTQQIEVANSREGKSKTLLYFELDLTSNPNSSIGQKLLKDSQIDGLTFFRKIGKTVKMLSRKEINPNSISGIFAGRVPEKELSKTKLEACMVDIVYSVEGDNITYKVYAKGWASLSKEETHYVNLLHKLKIEPKVEDITKTIESINELERLIKFTGYV